MGAILMYFRVPLVSFQAIHHKLAGMPANLTKMQLMPRLAQLQAEGKLTDVWASFDARLAREVIAQGREMRGGNEILPEHQIAPHHADIERG